MLELLLAAKRSQGDRADVSETIVSSAFLSIVTWTANGKKKSVK